jgi:hypothetical protein
MLAGDNNKLTRETTMKPTYLLLFIPFLLVADVQADTLTADEYASAEKYIVECATDWAESVVTGDVSRRKVYFSVNFLGTQTNGDRYEKAAVVRERSPSEVYVSNTINSVDIKFYGETAIAYGDETWVKKDGSSGRFVWTDIWVHADGVWQIVAAQDVDAPVEGE